MTANRSGSAPAHLEFRPISENTTLDHVTSVVGERSLWPDTDINGPPSPPPIRYHELSVQFSSVYQLQLFSIRLGPRCSIPARSSSEIMFAQQPPKKPQQKQKRTKRNPYTKNAVSYPEAPLPAPLPSSYLVTMHFD